uniref:Uncharacterized protein n=1 Tax=Ditylenchus dipsaci TaxID=166011 RepID=A0A915D8K7_9BILA
MSSRTVGKWLLGCAGLVYGAVAGGGFVRRTDSAASIVDWNLLLGIIPPFGQAQWQEEFERYKTFPIYKFKSQSGDGEMSLTSLSQATSWNTFTECGVELLAWSFSCLIKMILAGSLIVSQGLIGWWMVESGLDPSQNTSSDIPRVSQYRLTAHFTMATTLYSLFLYTGLSNLLNYHDYSEVPHIGKLRSLTSGCKVLIFTTVIMGAFVAGLNAGTVCNTWPKYDGHWIPENIFAKHPAWKNFFENQVTVQFMHRNLAYLTFGIVALTWLVGPVFMQMSSGLSTLLSRTNSFFATLHQNESLLLISMIIWLSNELKKVIK